MRELELLAPARNADIGIAAIDCGADAVYIAGPDFGARKAAGNPVGDIARLCAHAHRYGARVFVTFNINLREGEEEQMHAQMLAAQQAGADAFIIRDLRCLGWPDITVPLHASTQCAIHSVEDARRFEAAGCARIILERELSLETIRAICAAVSCEVECFIHGALCVCYSGQCRLSAWLDGRSADRGDCIQACRSRYDLVDAAGHTLVRDKTLLSLRDLNLSGRLGELADAGVGSFKIEGRLKGENYVRNLVRLYAQELDALVAAQPEKYRRASFGRVSGAFTPDAAKTFNRGYTTLFLYGVREQGWASMEAPTHLGEKAGTVRSLRREKGQTRVLLKPEAGLRLHNGDGFCFLSGSEIIGFRGDVCSGAEILCRAPQGLREGTVLYRNIDADFEKSLASAGFRREIAATIHLRPLRDGALELTARSEDGREASVRTESGLPPAQNRERQLALLEAQLAKRASAYHFSVDGWAALDGAPLPLLSAAALNGLRRDLAQQLDAQPCRPKPLFRPARPLAAPAAAENPEADFTPLMRSKYCIRFELGRCPVHQGAKDGGTLYLLNNGRRLKLIFDCKSCEMQVTRG